MPMQKQRLPNQIRLDIGCITHLATASLIAVWFHSGSTGLKRETAVGLAQRSGDCTWWSFAAILRRYAKNGIVP